MTNRFKPFTVIFLVLFAHLSHSATANSELLSVRYPTVKSDPVYKELSIYFHDLLDLLISKLDRPYELIPVTVPPVPTNRTVIMMDQGKYDVSWIHTDDERERDLRPIRYPIFRGLGGWRLFLIEEQNEKSFSHVNSLEKLRELKPGQGHDWPDTTILRANKFNVVTSFSRDNLLRMLQHRRIDFYPRGVNEIWDEVALPEAKGIIVEPHLVLRYPTAFYLYVSKKDEKLAQLLEQGFELAIKDGSFKKLFYQFAGESLKRANLVNRRVIEIHNPILSKKTPVKRKELWFNIEELKN